MWKLAQHSFRKPSSFFTLTNKPSFTPFFRNLYIQIETTPAENSLKFKPGQTILDASKPCIEMNSITEAQKMGSPMAISLLRVQGIQSVFYGPDFITVTKEPNESWATLKPHVFSILTDYFTQGLPILQSTSSSSLNEEDGTGASAKHKMLDTTIHADDTEVVAMIKELIASRIRPTIQEDGGDVEFCGFNETEGIVYLKLKGACRTCESSVITLKKGIQNMLQYFIPEVKSVKQLEDDAFEEFEKTLSSQSIQSSSSTTATTSSSINKK